MLKANETLIKLICIATVNKMVNKTKVWISFMFFWLLVKLAGRKAIRVGLLNLKYIKNHLICSFGLVSLLFVSWLCWCHQIFQENAEFRKIGVRKEYMLCSSYEFLVKTDLQNAPNLIQSKYQQSPKTNIINK